MICKLLLVDPTCAIRLSRRKVLFSGLKFIKHDSRKVQQSDSYKQPQREKSQICPSPHPTAPIQKRWSPALVLVLVLVLVLRGPVLRVLFCTASQITRLGECAHLPKLCTRAVHKLTHNYHGYLKWRHQDR